MLFTYPYVDGLPLMSLAIGVIIVLSAMWALRNEHRVFVYAGAIGVAQAAADVVNLWAASHALTCVALALLSTFHALCLFVVLRFTLFGRAGSREKLVGAMCGYLLAGFFFSSLYRLVLMWNPLAFGVSAGHVDTIYFSFITLCTIGYGDLTPQMGVARSLALFEGVFGVFYIAVLVSRLVTLTDHHFEPGEASLAERGRTIIEEETVRV